MFDRLLWHDCGTTSAFRGSLVLESLLWNQTQPEPKVTTMHDRLGLARSDRQNELGPRRTSRA